MQQVEHVYSSLFYKSKIKPLVAQRWAHDKGKMGPNQKLFCPMSSSQALTKEIWEGESPEVRALVIKERQDRHEAALAQFELLETSENRTPEQYQM
jgi:hypothetical protein